VDTVTRVDYPVPMSLLRNRVTSALGHRVEHAPWLGQARALRRAVFKRLWSARTGLPMIRNVQIQTHSHCNANCVICPRAESWHAAHPGEMSDAVFRRILDELRPFSFCINRGRVNPYLMQEPLLDPKLFERIEMIWQRLPGTIIGLSTNGVALTEDVRRKLVATLAGRKHVIWISHHGIDAPTLRRVMDLDGQLATRRIVELLKLADGRLRVEIRGAGRSFDGRVQLFSDRAYRDHWRAIFRSAEVNPWNVHVGTFAYHDRAGTIHRADRGANENNLGFRRRVDREHPFHCERIDEWVHFMYDGTIRICCMDYHGEVTLPNIMDVTLSDYFRSDTYRDLVGKVSGLSPSDPDFIFKRCASPGG